MLKVHSDIKTVSIQNNFRQHMSDKVMEDNNNDKTADVKSQLHCGTLDPAHPSSGILRGWIKIGKIINLAGKSHISICASLVSVLERTQGFLQILCYLFYVLTASDWSK